MAFRGHDTRIVIRVTQQQHGFQGVDHRREDRAEPVLAIQALEEPFLRAPGRLLAQALRHQRIHPADDFVDDEEGRVRWQKKFLMSGDSVTHYYYDYFEKDHLGNTRVILTTQKDTTLYAATMEAAARAKELALFYNIDSTSIATTSVPGGYPADGSSPNDSVAVVAGSTGRHTMGPAILLKVMSGDSIAIGVKSYYVAGTSGGTSSSLSSILNSLAGGLSTLSGVGHGAFNFGS